VSLSFLSSISHHTSGYCYCYYYVFHPLTGTMIKDVGNCAAPPLEKATGECWRRKRRRGRMEVPPGAI